MTAATSPSLADLVRDERSKRKWTQEQLADRADVSTWTVNRVERGHLPNSLTIAALAEALEVPYDRLKALKEAS